MDDVGSHAATTFAQLPLRAELKRALQTMGFHVPSPIQLKALPIALFGSDVIGQAKSGTGKTAVFGLAAVEHVLARVQQLQQASTNLPTDPFVLVLAPTREIAMQIDSVLRQLAAESGDIRIVPLIGGLPIAQDQRRLRAGCHIAIGTPGRVRWLIEDGVFHPKSVRLLVFDEVDKLLSGEFLQDIDAIVAAVPDRRQTLAFSATFTPDQLMAVARTMRDPQVVRVRGPDDVTVELVSCQEKQLTEWIEREKQHEPELWLRHVRQYYRVIKTKTVSTSDPLNLKPKLVLLANLLAEISFNQCIVFCNDKFRAEALATALESQGWPTAAITGAQSQTTRNSVMGKFRSFALRVLVSTDLTARGIDVDRVNFVVNLDLPRDPATYLHRGLAVTLLTAGEVEGIHLLSRVFRMSVDELPSPVPRDVRAYVAAASAVAAETSPENFTRDMGQDGAEEKRDAAEVEVHQVEEREEREDTNKPTGEVEEVVAYLPRQSRRGAADSGDSGDTSRAADRMSAATPHRSLCPLSPEGVAPVAKTQVSASFQWEERCYAQWLALVK